MSSYLVHGNAEANWGSVVQQAKWSGKFAVHHKQMCTVCPWRPRGGRGWGGRG